MATFACIQLTARVCSCPTCIRPTHVAKTLYCYPLLTRFRMQASVCQHIKSLCIFAGASPVLTRQSQEDAILPESTSCTSSAGWGA